MSFSYDSDDFFLSQNVNLAQIENKQIKFLVENSDKKTIFPFNLDVIINKLSPTKETKLFIFFLDHRYLGSNANYPIQSFINQLVKLECKHFYTFVDSCNSCSMIEHIKASDIFVHLFPNFPEEFSTIFIQYLGTLDNSDALSHSVIDKEILSEIIKAKLGDSNLCINDCISTIERELERLISYPVEKKKQFSELINILSYLKAVPFIPNIFVKFSKKATVYTSSIHHSFTLPARRIYVANFKNYRPCGNIFTSIYIQAFLNSPSKIENFNELIKILFQRYKNEFERIIIEQCKSFNLMKQVMFHQIQ